MSDVLAQSTDLAMLVKGNDRCVALFSFPQILCCLGAPMQQVNRKSRDTTLVIGTDKVHVHS